MVGFFYADYVVVLMIVYSLYYCFNIAVLKRGARARSLAQCCIGVMYVCPTHIQSNHAPLCCDWQVGQTDCLSEYTRGKHQAASQELPGAAASTSALSGKYMDFML